MSAVTLDPPPPRDPGLPEPEGQPPPAKPWGWFWAGFLGFIGVVVLLAGPISSLALRSSPVSPFLLVLGAYVVGGCLLAARKGRPGAVGYFLAGALGLPFGLLVLLFAFCLILISGGAFRGL